MLQLFELGVPAVVDLRNASQNLDGKKVLSTNCACKEADESTYEPF